MKTIDFEDISYLNKGTGRQKIAFAVIRKNFIFEKLKQFQPVLAGTIPIGIDIWSSDLDILCYWDDKQEFISTIIRNFENEDSFKITNCSIRDIDTVIANFVIEEFEFEVFGQNVPVKEQFGYKHMIAEHKILKEKGEEFRKEIIMLKNQGYKTEPAFAKLLNLEGDPFLELLKIWC